MEVWRLLAYHPGRNGSELQISDLFNGTYYPEGMERTPNAYAIVKANQIAVSQSDLIVCYVWHMGNTEKLLRCAHRQGVRVINLAPPRDATRL